MVSMVRSTGLAFLCFALSLSAHAAGGKSKDKSSGDPAAASTAAAQASDAPSSSGTSASGGGGGSSTNLASWLAAVAAQNLGLRLATVLKNDCTANTKCLIMVWSDFIAASYRIQAVKNQLALFESATELSTQGLSIIQLHCNPPAGLSRAARETAINQGRRKFNNVLIQTQALSGVKTDAVDSTAPASSSTAANATLGKIVANMGVVGTGVNVVAGIYKALQPTYAFGSPTSGGIDTNDLIVAMQAGADRPDRFLLSPPVAKGELLSKLNDINAKLGANQAEAQRQAIEPKCKDYKQQLDGLGQAIGNVQTQLQGFIGSFSTGSTTFAGLVQDDALDTYLKTQSPRLLDLNLSSNTAVSSTKSHWYGSVDQIMQTTLISRFRVVDAANSTVLRAGSDAVYCQAYFRIGPDTSSLVGSTTPDTGDMYETRVKPASKPMCFDHIAGPISALPSTPAGKATH